ncbi:CAP domain-containing protein [Blastococcus sp. TF02A-26]|uniref:CAP domain-containing protein n=1 Tax=Blastococcus sp. TF02A-26 TaxID=2250577 RepID=UPI001F1655AA|nr:CAP domain-containing protein [Blastococcus sp. TF02A-26]
MHHLPVGPSPIARLAAALRRRSGLLTAAAACAVVAALVLTAVLLTGGAGSPEDPATAGASSPAPSPEGAETAPAAPPSTAAGAPDTSTAPPPPDPAPASTVAEAPPAASTAGTPEAGPADPVPPRPAPRPAPQAAPAPPPVAARPAPAAPAAAPPNGPVEAQVLALVNQQRAAAGCAAVTADAGLAAVARAHSADMRDRGFFDHTNPDRQDPFDRAAAAGSSARAENIARGQADAAAVMQAWMTSPGHRANILNCGLTRLGVGVADGPGGPWWTQLFG